MAGILVGAGFVRIDADTKPAKKALLALGGIAGNALTTTMLPATAAIVAGVGAIAASLTGAVAVVGVFGAAVASQFSQISEASSHYETAQKAQEKAELNVAQARAIAAKHGIKYGDSLKITSKMSAESRREAEQYNRALGAAKSATEAATDAQAMYQQKLAAMPPATRNTALAMQKLKDDFKKWSDSLAGSTMPIFTRLIDNLRLALPKLTPFVKIAALQFSQFFDSFSKGTTANAVFSQFGDNIQKHSGGSLKNFLGILRDMVVGFVGILNAFMPMSNQVSGGLADMAARFANWGANLKYSQGFENFITRVRETAPKLGEALREIGSAISTVLTSMGPLAGIGAQVALTLARIIQATPTRVLELLIPAILAVNIGLKLYALYTAAAAAVTWAFTTSITANTGIVYTSRAVWLAHRIILLSTAAATVIATVATWALNAAIAVLTSPITAVIVVIGLLVAGVIYAYRNFEGFRKVVDAVWAGIKTASLFAWNNVLKPIFNGLVVAFKVVATAATWLWKNVLQPAFAGIGAVAKIMFVIVATLVLIPLVVIFKLVAAIATWLWKTVLVPTFNAIGAQIKAVWEKIIKPAFNLFVAAMKGIGTAATWLWRNVIVPVWNSISKQITSSWAIIKAIFNGIMSFIRGPLATAWNWLWRNVLVHVWNGIRTTVSSAWVYIKPIFDRMKSGVALVGRAFDTARGAIKTAWDKIKSITRGPVKFVVDTVYNNGIRKIWNFVAGIVDAKQLPFAKFAQGGRTRGGQPGVDSIPILAMADEFMFNRDASRKIGYGNLEYMNRTGEVPPWIRGYKDGGVIDTVGGWLGGAAKKVGGAVMSGIDFLSDPAKMWDKAIGPVKALIKKVGSNKWAQLMARIPTKMIAGLKDNIMDSVKDLGGMFGLGSGGGGGGAGVKRWTGVVQQALRMLGQPAGYTAMTLRRMNQESGGNPTVVNKWDSNWKAGYPSVGLMQVIGPTFRAYAGVMKKIGPFLYGTSVNPLANVYASMRYALAAYGSLPRAYNRAGGYDAGGMLPPGLSMVYNGTRKPERVLNEDQWNAMRNGSGAIIHLTIENHGVLGSRGEVLDWLTDSLDVLRRQGRLGSIVSAAVRSGG